VDSDLESLDQAFLVQQSKGVDQQPINTENSRST